jgi:tetratricopeptide (TPR) repeat protein
MTTENDITLVEKYFDRELSEAEVSYVHERVELDNGFRTLFNQEKDLIKGIRLEGLRRDLDVLRDVERSIKSDESSTKTVQLNTWYFKAAAAIVFFVVAAKLLLPVHEDPDKLYQSYFKPYPNVFEPTLRGALEEESLRSEAFQAYDQGNYQKALVGFNSILKEGNEPSVLLLTGNCNLILGNISEAKNNFRTLIKNYKENDTQAKWYLSLCYLKEGDVDRARMMWEELSGTEVSYANKAKELLKRVD